MLEMADEAMCLEQQHAIWLEDGVWVKKKASAKDRGTKQMKSWEECRYPSSKTE